jgi:hypothetical protein
MILTSIELWTVPYGSAAVKHATLSLQKTNANQSYILRQAAGLDPNDIFSQFYGVSSDAGGLGLRYDPGVRYYNLKPETRHVTLDIKLNPNHASGETASSLRDALYRMLAFDHTGDVQMRFFNGLTHVANLDAFVTRIESDLFSKETSVQISLRCRYAFLRAPTKTTVPSTDPVQLSQIWNYQDVNSTAPHGLYLKIRVDAGHSQLVVRGHPGNASSEFKIVHPFAAGDIVHLSSEFDNRFLYKTTSPIHIAKTNLMDAVEFGGVWPLVFPGQPNTLLIGEPDIFMLEFSYYAAYWGV